ALPGRRPRGPRGARPPAGGPAAGRGAPGGRPPGGGGPPPHRGRPAAVRKPLTSFVGRDEDVARVLKMLDEGRLVTLTGPGGAGKTRLALEMAARLSRVAAARGRGDGPGRAWGGGQGGLWEENPAHDPGGDR